MQVVYSGGASPATQRRCGAPRTLHMYCNTGKKGYSRPTLPGNPPSHATLYPQRSIDSGHSYHSVHSQHAYEVSDRNVKDSIPVMPKPVAIVCLVANIICPGLGTFLSGLTVFCGAKIRPADSNKRQCLFVNTGVALLQFLTAFIFLLGWIWSITWGAAFIAISDKFYDIEHKSKDPEKANNKSNNKRPGNLKIKNVNCNAKQPAEIPKKLNSPAIVLHEAPNQDIEKNNKELTFKTNNHLQVSPCTTPSHVETFHFDDISLDTNIEQTGGSETF